MIKNKIWFLIGFFAVMVAGIAVAVVLKDGGSTDVSQPIKPTALPEHIEPIALPADAISISQPSDKDSDEIIQNQAAGYYFSMPTNWYVEKNTGTVYPDYDPQSGIPPDCKIEISAFLNSTGSNLDDWITANLHADPTADIAQAVRTPISIGGSPAIEWQGTLNGVTTTLAYVEASGTFFEIAPSTLSEADNADNSDCDPMFQALINNIHFGTYGS